MALHPNTVKLIEGNNEINNTSDGGLKHSFDHIPEEYRLDYVKQAIGRYDPISTSAQREDYSRYIKGAIDPIYGDIDEERAQEQGKFKKFAYTFPRIATKVAAEIAKMPGEIAGFAEWGASGFKFEDFNEKVNNAWVQAIDEAYTATNDELFPVYKRRVVEEGGLLRQIASPEFWATEGADGVGFLLSMFTPGLALKATKLGAKTAKGLAKMAKISKPETVAKLGKNIDDYTAGFVNTLVESGAEGMEAAKAVEESIKNKKFKEYIQLGFTPEESQQYAEEYIQTDVAKKMVGKAGANTVLANFAILLGPNILDQKWLFSGLTRSNIGESVAKNKLGKIVAGLGDETAESITKATGKDFAKEALTKGFIGVGKEGFFEEGMQFASAKYFEDKALLNEDPNFIESVVGTLNTYIESLSDIDMQKSIFLGSVLGGGMGAIAGVRGKSLENKILFGDKKKGTEGLKSLLEKNFITRFQSLNDILDSESPYNEDGSPNVDIAKAQTWASDILKSEQNKELLAMYQEAGITDQFDFAKMVHDFNYMLPFLQQEGGMDLLKEHVNQLSQKQSEYLKSIGVTSANVENVKKELLDKAEKFNDIYYGTILNHKLPKIEIADKHKSLFKEFDAEVSNTKISNELMQSLYSEQIDNVKKEIANTSSKIAELEGKDNRTTVQETELKNLKSKLESLNKDVDIAQTSFTAMKEERPELDKKENIQKWWNEKVEAFEQNKKEVAEEVVTETSNDKTSAETTKKVIDQTDLEDKTKEDLKKKADSVADEKQVTEEKKEAISDEQAKVVAQKFVDKKAGRPVDITEEDIAKFAEPSVQRHIANIEAQAEMSRKKEMFDNATEGLNEMRNSSTIEQIPGVPEEERFQTEVFVDFNEPPLVITAPTEKDLWKKIDAHYDQMIRDLAARMGLPAPNAYQREAIKSAVEVTSVPDEITQYNDKLVFDEDELVADVLSVGYRSKSIVNNQGKIAHNLDKEGRVILEKTVNHKILEPGYLNGTTRVIAKIGIYEKDDQAYMEQNKNNIDSIPIMLTTEEGEFIGYIHDVAWYDTRTNITPDLRELLKQQTRDLRSNFLTDGKIDINKSVPLTITHKYSGWLNRASKQLTMAEAFVTKEGKHDLRVKLGTISSSFVSDSLRSITNWSTTKEGKSIIDMITANTSGSVIAAVPSANGTYLVTKLNQTTLKNAGKSADFVVRNVLGILSEAAKDTNISNQELFDNLMMYIHPHMGNMDSKTATNLMATKPYIMFNVDLFSAGNQRNVTVKIQETESRFGTYRIEHTKDGLTITRATLDGATKKLQFLTENRISPEVFEDVIKTGLKNKYINFNTKAADQSNKGELTTMKVSDEKYNITEVQVNYRDFLSEHNVVSTRVHGVETESGFIAYATQPTLEINPVSIPKDDTKKTEEKTEDAPESNIPETPNDILNQMNGDTEIEWGFDDGTVTDFLEVDLSVDYEKTTVSSFSAINNIVAENNVVLSLTAGLLNLAKNTDLSQDATANEFIDKLLEGLKHKRDLHVKYSTEQVIKEDAAKLKIPFNKQANASYANNINKIIDNFEESFNEDGSVKFIGYRAKINMELAKLKFVPEVEELNETVDETAVDETHVDNKNLKTDPEKSASARIKRELYNIPLLKDGKAVISGIGLPIPRDYSVTFNTIMESLADLNIDEMMPELEALANNADIKDEIYKQVLKLVNTHLANINKDPFFNEFHTVFRKQRGEFKTVLFYTNDKGLPSLRIIDANKIGSAGVLVDKWHQSHLIKGEMSGLIIIDRVNGTMSVDKTKASEIQKKFISVADALKNNLYMAVSAKESIQSNMFEPLANVFSEIGLDISPEALKKMFSIYLSKPARLTGLKVVANQNNVSNFNVFLKDNFLFIFNELIKTSESEIEQTDDDGLKANIFATQGKYINILARMESIVNPSVLSSSFRNAAGDTLYGFVNPHYMSNTITTLKSSPEQFANDVFTQNSTWLHTYEGTTKVINRDALKELRLHYFDAAKNGNSKKEAVSFENMNPFEKEQTKVALYLNNSSSTGLFFTIAPSDKTTFTLLHAPKEVIKKQDLDDKGMLKANTALADRLFSLLVESEIKRINATHKEFAKLEGDQVTESQLLNDYHFTYAGGTRRVGSGGYFFMIPQMNEILSVELERLDKNHNDIIELSSERRTEIKQKLIDLLNGFIDLKANDWTATGMYSRIDKTAHKKAKNTYGANIVDNAITTDYVINNMVSYANQYMLITGDPAKFVKTGKWNGTRSDWATLIDSSAANLFKRAAKDIAPGYEGKFPEEEKKYKIVMVNEPVTKQREVKKQYQNVLEQLLVGANKTIKLADAQVWSSLPEHLRVLAAIGRITNEKKNNLMRKYDDYMKAKAEGKLTEENKFTDAELGLILQPLKPVEVGRLYMNTASPTAVDLYIKSSVFPLIPQLTEGLEIDKIAQFMHKFGIDKVVPSTAIKTGFHNSMDIYKDGQIVLPDNQTFVESKIHQLDRSFMRIQQDVPYNAKKIEIYKGSQGEKLQFSDLDEAWKFFIQGKSYKGHQLKEKNDAIRTELYRRKWQALLKELDAYEENGVVEINSFEKLRERIIKEAIERNSFDANDIMLISQLAKEFGSQTLSTIPLFLHPAMPKIEPLLNSIIKNDVLVTKFPGKSYVQGSAMGFDFMLSGTEETLKKATQKTGIVRTKDYKGYLDYRVTEKATPKGTTKYYEADVLLPWYFQEEIKDYTYEEDGVTYIDTTKVDSQLLTLIGYRIPTQGHNSMIKLKAVGFLPKSSGDLIIIPPKMVEQMGSDFDVDKLYTHRYNYFTADGKLRKVKVNPEGDLTKMSTAQLQNLSIEITHSVLENINVGEKVIKPLDNDNIKDTITKIEELKNKGKKSKVSDRTKASQSSLLFDDLHSRYVEINASGKFGIGVSSIGSTGHVLSQYAGLYLPLHYTKDGDVIDNSILFSDKKGGQLYSDTAGSGQLVLQTSVKKHEYENAPPTGLWRLDRIYSVDNVTKISEVLQNIQTESVDNANNQRLYGMHLNKETFDVALFLAKMGLTEYHIGLFLNQPIIKDYITRVLNISDIGSTDYKVGEQDRIAQNLLLDYSDIAKVVDVESMEEAISRNSNLYTDSDKNILVNFLKIKNLSKTYGSVLRALNTDTKFLGKNLDSNVTKMEQFRDDVEGQATIGNVQNLIDEANPTNQYSAYKYGVLKGMKLFQRFVPYQSTLMVRLKDDIKRNSKKKIINENTVSEINRAVRSAIWVKAAINSLGITDIEGKRKALLFGGNNLAQRIVKERETNDNTLLKYIEVTIPSKDTLPATLEFSAGGAIEKDFSLKLQQSFLQLYKSNPALAEDILIYTILNGAERNARDLFRFVPIDLLLEKNIVNELRNIYIDAFAVAGASETKNQFNSNFLRQYYQHNPARALAVSSDSIRKTGLFDASGKNTDSISNAYTINVHKEHDMFSDQDIPKYIYFYDNFKMHLFEFVPTEEGISYKRLNLLGDSKNLLTEYNITQEYKESIFPQNAIKKGEKTGTTIKTDPKPEVPLSGMRLLKEFHFLHNNNKGISTILKRISNNPKVSEGFRELAKIFDTYDFSDIKTIVSQNSELTLDGTRSMKGIAGTMYSDRKILVINADMMSPNMIAKKSEDVFAIVLLHELSHALTTKKINDRDKLNPEEAKIIDNLEKLFLTARAEIQKKLTTLDPTSSEYTLLKKYFDKVIGIEDQTKAFKEFIARAMTEPSTQNILNSIQTEDNISIWDKLIAILTDIIKTINPDIKIEPNSVLAKTVQQVLTLNKIGGVPSTTVSVNIPITTTTQQASTVPVIETFEGKWTRNDVEQQTDKLFIFTDNTDRNSGSGIIPDNSWYAQKYGKGKHFPTMTTAVIRGLDNARPISTQRWYNSTKKGVSGRWQDADIQEFKKVIDAEFADILEAWNTGTYKSIVFPAGDGLFNAQISAITQERTPQLYAYLQSKYNELVRQETQQPTPVATTTQQVSTTPEFDKLPSRSQTPTMTYAGIGSRKTPADIKVQMIELAKELEAMGYTLRSGHAQGADLAFEEGVTSKKEIFRSNVATDLTRKIAQEIHPNSKALGTGIGLDLMARNTNQIFGENLDTPVDFVIAWTPDGLTDYRNRTIQSGGTGQAIDMASRKGIPVINMFDRNWKEQLNTVLKNQSINTFAEDIYSQLGDKTQSENVIIRPLSELSNKGGILADGSINSLRNSSSNEHFGNPFDSKDTKGTVRVASTSDAVKLFIEWADTDNQFASITDINGEPIDLWSVDYERRQWVRDQINSGTLQNKPILYYKELGEPSHATALDYLINKTGIRPVEQIKPTPKQPVLTESPVFKEAVGGNYYRFFYSDGVVIKGEYSQGRVGNWQPMNLKNAILKDAEIKANPSEYKIYTGEPVITESIQEKYQGKTIVVPEGSNPTNLPIFEDAKNVYLMNDGQQEAYDFLKSRITEMLSNPYRFNYNLTSLEELINFENLVDKNFNNIIPRAMFDNFIGLAGRGGTGKTTIIKKIIKDITDEFGDKYNKLNVKYIVPTHNAGTVLQESLGLNSERVGGQVDTVANYTRTLPITKKSKMYPGSIGNPYSSDTLFRMISIEDYKKQVDMGRSPVSEPDILIFDESSMLSSGNLFALITRIKHDYEKGLSSKMPIFLFLGDYRQLPPVNDKLSENAEIGPISSLVLSNSDKSYELTQVMRSSDGKLHEIFDSVGKEIVSNLKSKKETGKSRKMSFSEYDALTNKSSENMLVVKKSGINGVIEDYTDYLMGNNNPYGMFWIHYNAINRPETKELFERIRDNYFKKLLNAGFITQEDMVLPEHRNFRVMDYVQYTGNLEFEQHFKFSEKSVEGLVPVANKDVNSKDGTYLKPNSRYKVVKITPSKVNLVDLAPEILIKHIDSNIVVDSEDIILYNRQNKFRGIKFATGVGVHREYDIPSASHIITLTDIKTGKNLGEFKVHHRLWINNPEIQEFLTAINSADGSTSLFKQLEPSYIGSSHTAQGNSIKNVIVGDYNIKYNASVAASQSSVFSSMYTSLTRTSSRLIIIKPDTSNIVANQDVFTGLVDDNNQIIKKGQTEDFLEVDEKTTTFADKALNKTYSDLKDSFELLKDILNASGVSSIEMIDTLSPQEVGQILRKYCK